MKEHENSGTVIELICEICGEPMNFTGEIINEFPNKKYMHRCNSCGHVQVALDPYPKINNVEAL